MPAFLTSRTPRAVQVPPTHFCNFFFDTSFAYLRLLDCSGLQATQGIRRKQKSTQDRAASLLQLKESERVQACHPNAVPNLPA